MVAGDDGSTCVTDGAAEDVVVDGVVAGVVVVAAGVAVVVAEVVAGALFNGAPTDISQR